MADSNITKNALASALKKLMEQEDFSKISVGDICEDCGMNRKSFYYHFRDKYDLVNWIFDTEFIMAASKNDFQSEWELLEDICRYLYQEQNFYSHAFQITAQNSSSDYFCQRLRPILLEFTKECQISPAYADFFLSLFCDVVYAALVRWISEGTDLLSPDLFLKELRRITASLSQNLLRDELESKNT